MPRMPKSKEVKQPPVSKREVRPRAPLRGRGIVRYAALLDATEALLQEQSTDDVGLYQIAERANIPPASVYHFFPTKEAAFLALAQRYLDGLNRLGSGPIPASALSSWQSLVAWDHRQAVKYYNSHRPALKLFLGGFGGEEVQQASKSFDETVGRRIYDRLNQLYYMPFLRDPEKKFHICVAMMDAIWTISYLRSGVITEEYYEEGVAACTAYCRIFLPDQIELRDEVRALAERGEDINVTRTEQDAAE